MAPLSCLLIRFENSLLEAYIVWYFGNKFLYDDLIRAKICCEKGTFIAYLHNTHFTLILYIHLTADPHT